jgi:4-aminobutyrate aminotransferase/(S)-3-amino-2-methylpropionate transaminase
VQGLRRICDQYGILLIADEIQTGFARTGKMFAIEHSGVTPDLMTMAKSLAGGFPLSAVCGRKDIMDAANPGGLGGTYGGSPLGCAAGLAVLKVIESENLIERAQQQGALMVERLTALQNRNSVPCIGDVRNLGAMVAIELVKDRDSKAPDADLAKALVGKCADKGLVILSCGTYGNVIRFLVPLVASDALLNEGLDILESALEELLAA